MRHLLVQSATLEKLTVENVGGIQTRVWTSSGSYPCRISRNGQSGFVQNRAGDAIRVGEKKTVMYSLLDMPVQKDDKVTICGVSYTVDSVHAHSDGSPSRHHLYSELTILQ